MGENEPQAFSATAPDQFGLPMGTQPAFTWSIAAGLGAIDPSTGVYTSPASAGNATIAAASGTVDAVASIAITAPQALIVNTTQDQPVGPGLLSLRHALDLCPEDRAPTTEPEWGHVVKSRPRSDRRRSYAKYIVDGENMPRIDLMLRYVRGLLSLAVTAQPATVPAIPKTPFSLSIVPVTENVSGGARLVLQVQLTNANTVQQASEPKPTIVGIAATNSIVVPSMFAGRSEWFYVQRVEDDIFAAGRDGLSYHNTDYGVLGLDNTWPYVAAVPFSLTGWVTSVQATFYDSPIASVPDFRVYKSVSDNFSAFTTIMFFPPGPESRPVPLAEMHWEYEINVDLTLTRNAAGTHATAAVAYGKSPTFRRTADFPEWSVGISNGFYVLVRERPATGL